MLLYEIINQTAFYAPKIGFKRCIRNTYNVYERVIQLSTVSYIGKLKIRVRHFTSD